MSMSTRKQGLDDIATVIRNVRASLATSTAKIDANLSELDSLPTTYASVLEEINALGSADASDILQKDELTKLTAEFLDLKTTAAAIVSAISSIE